MGGNMTVGVFDDYNTERIKRMKKILKIALGIMAFVLLAILIGMPLGRYYWPYVPEIPEEVRAYAKKEASDISSAIASFEQDMKKVVFTKGSREENYDQKVKRCFAGLKEVLSPEVDVDANLPLARKLKDSCELSWDILTWGKHEIEAIKKQTNNELEQLKKQVGSLKEAQEDTGLAPPIFLEPVISEDQKDNNNGGTTANDVTNDKKAVKKKVKKKIGQGGGDCPNLKINSENISL